MAGGGAGTYAGTGKETPPCPPVDGTTPLARGGPIPVVDTGRGIVDMYGGPSEAVTWGAPPSCCNPPDGSTLGGGRGTGAPIPTAPRPVTPAGGTPDVETLVEAPVTKPGPELLGGSPTLLVSVDPETGTNGALVVTLGTKGGIMPPKSEGWTAVKLA